jgi:hypothetical protein
MPRAASIFVLIASFWAPANGAAAEPPRFASAEDFRVPERIGEFELERLSDYVEQKLGFRAEYRGPVSNKQMLVAYVYNAVHRAGFDRELIWETQHEPDWVQPTDLRLDEFRQFHRKTLRRRPLVQQFGGGVWFADEPAPAPETQ